MEPSRGRFEADSNLVVPQIPLGARPAHGAETRDEPRRWDL